MEELTRRNFVKGAVLMGGAAAVAGFSGCSSKTAKADYLPESWDLESDIVIVGNGAAGLSAAITVMKEELGEALVVEAAPEQYTGGNSRVCGQLMFIPKTVDGAVTYQTNLNAHYEVEKELLQAWAENICENLEWMKGLGADMQASTACNPEFPDVPGSEHCATYTVDGVTGKSVGWEFLAGQQSKFGWPTEYDTRATELIFNPATKEVFGIKAEKGGGTVYIKARKGVILACGGYENNPEMIKTYYSPSGDYEVRPGGTPYNRGEGITMAQSIGAKLWNMNNYSLAYPGAPITKDNVTVTYPKWSSKDYIYISPDSKRYAYEETTTLTKHGKTLANGVYLSAHFPMPNHVIFGHKAFEAGAIFPSYPYNWPGLMTDPMAKDNQGYVDAGLIMKADTVRELAGKLGLDPDILEETVNTYNDYCKNGVDLDYGRGKDYYANFTGLVAASGGTGSGSKGLSVAVKAFPLVPLEAPFYGFQQYQTILNSQGGPKRNVIGQIVDTKGNGIPRLYGAGELGCVYSYMYNGGGNFSEAISSGRLAARSCGVLEAWDSTEK